jgi:hypothetical protein
MVRTKPHHTGAKATARRWFDTLKIKNGDSYITTTLGKARHSFLPWNRIAGSYTAK